VVPVDQPKLYQVDDDGALFISPVIRDWSVLEMHGIDTVIDLEGGLDECIPTVPGSCLYVYFPIFDEDLPDLEKLEAVAALGAHLVASGRRVLSHCGMGFNRSALIAGRILHRLGMPDRRSSRACASAGPVLYSMRCSPRTFSGWSEGRAARLRQPLTRPSGCNLDEGRVAVSAASGSNRATVPGRRF
jgi:hypothetical protein